MEEPVQIVKTGNQGTLQLIIEKIKLLEEEDRPVTVVSAVGELRIGKSYLLSRILRASFPPGKSVYNILQAAGSPGLIFLSKQWTGARHSGHFCSKMRNK